MKDDVDVVVVGAGPTGLMLARELVLGGVMPVVIDRLPWPSGVSKALGLTGRTIDIFEYRGLLPRFEAAAHEAPAFPPEAASMIGSFVHFGGVPIDLGRVPGPPLRFLNIFQSGVERCLEKCAGDLGVRSSPRSRTARSETGGRSRAASNRQ